MTDKILFKKGYNPTIDARDALSITHEFLLFCRQWALEKEIPKRLAEAAETDITTRATPLAEWETYVKFTDHAIYELESGTLDHWFKSRNKGQH
jgi:hypothetical protein